MKSKKEQNRMVVVASLSKDLQYLKFPFSLNQNCLKRNKAFSVAEAMIALLIGSVALGMAAPMITKQIKQQNFQEVQYRILSQQLVPSGAIMFFDLAQCPEGWSRLDAKYNGRYFKVAGNYTICDKAGENSDGTCKGSAVKTVTDNNRGVFSGDAIRNMKGEFSAYEMGRSESEINYATGVFTVQTGTARGSSDHSGKAPKFGFDASRVVPTADENRPRSVSMLACRKN